jgi:Uma2 family endonuclease
MIANATDVKNNFGHYLEMLDREDVIILRNGKPVARLTHHNAFEQGFRLGETTAEYDVAGSAGQSEADDESAQRSMTFSQFMRMYEKTDQRFEFIDGKAFRMYSSSEIHQLTIGNLYVVLYNFLKGKKCRVYLSPFDIFMGSRKSDRNVVQPDLMVICDRQGFNEKGNYEGAPAITIEILSPSNRSHDLVRKMDLYLRSGVQEYWVVDPVLQNITIYQFDKGLIMSNKQYAGHDIAQSGYLEELEIPVKEIFE